MSERKVRYKCSECELNYVEHEGELCPLCARKNRTDGYIDPNAHRKSGCWSCKTPLSSDVNKICPKCHLLICPNCGACGCITITTKQN